jgi:hypothetical protein
MPQMRTLRMRPGTDKSKVSPSATYLPCSTISAALTAPEMKKKRTAKVVSCYLTNPTISDWSQNQHSCQHNRAGFLGQERKDAVMSSDSLHPNIPSGRFIAGDVRFFTFQRGIDHRPSCRHAGIVQVRQAPVPAVVTFAHAVLSELVCCLVLKKSSTTRQYQWTAISRTKSFPAMIQTRFRRAALAARGQLLSSRC